MALDSTESSNQDFVHDGNTNLKGGDMGIEERADAAYLRRKEEEYAREERATRSQRPLYPPLIHQLQPFAVQNLQTNVIPVRGSMVAYWVFVRPFTYRGKRQVAWSGSGAQGVSIAEDGNIFGECQEHPFIPERCTHLRHLKAMARLLHVVANAVPDQPYDRQRRNPWPHEWDSWGIEIVTPPQAYQLPASYPVREVRELLYGLPPLEPPRRRKWWRRRG